MDLLIQVSSFLYNLTFKKKKMINAEKKVCPK